MSLSGISERLLALGQKAEGEADFIFREHSRIAMLNTEKVLNAFQKHRVSESYFAGTTGYGYSDQGRDKLDEIYADVFGGEAGLVRLSFVNGTHAIACAIFSSLKKGDVLLSATGPLYDTLKTVVGQNEEKRGTFYDYGIGYREVPMLSVGLPDLPAIEAAASNKDVKTVFIQRSRGYSDRKALSCAMIKEIIDIVKKVNPHACILVDNCYGEFVEEIEPCNIGADLIAGSLIKNPGGGIAPSGGYVVGRKDLVEAAAYRLTVPGIGGECGATLGNNRLLYQGLFMAPHIVLQAIKTAVFCAYVMEDLGFSVSPSYKEKRYDIIQTIRFGKEEPLLQFCKGIQMSSPVDSFASPEPWDMPGYDCKVIMAAGTFIQGASIELSCDAPMREPYLAYLQGGLTFESGKLGILKAAQKISELK
ncbi:MAG: methionine gamma-lyase family protein [Clostridiales bacterium]|nr:methionine gamma-lyase family protein [Clostridiales bacterium]